ncbi:terminase large subunit [Roseovarius nubinhibens]|uniref:Terminase n=1 Tax=Roseovarius nubinhibens TaxID=314263 RepID=A0A348W762_9RHOB|nr:terminase [Roseovarius nubinhibens]|tara:strand:- start:29932 stop:31659 length:1728 start_codon:yes stop_codon:yes gene_type:complete
MSDLSWAACPDWWEKLQAGATPIPDLPLDYNLAEVAVALFDKLVVPDIPGQPTMGEVAEEWARDIVRAAFGSVDAKTGARLVGELFTLVPKKNTKTTLAACLGLIALQMNTTPNIRGVVVGPTQSVAETCFGQMQGMIEADEWLSKRFKIDTNKKQITDIFPDHSTGRPLNAKLKVTSFDPAVTTGGIPAFAILDELHVMAERHFARRVIGQVRGGMITNPRSLLIIITTQSEVPPQGVFKDELEYARKVRDGEITEDVRMLPILYEFPEAIQSDEKQPWKNPDMWGAVLPNLGRSITIERLIPEFRKAVETGEEELARWASQHLNIQIGLGHHTGGWAGANYWQRAVDPTLDLERLIETSEVVTVGIDGGGMDDLLGLAFLGRHKVSKRWQLWCAAWAHDVVLERRKSIAERLRDLERDDALTICVEPTQDIDELVALVLRVHKAGLLPERAGIGLDPEGVAAIVDALQGAGVPHDTLASVTQGYKLNGAIKGTERKLFDGSLTHADQPLMDWCVGNAKSEARGNAVIVTKAVSGAGKIDPLMAAFNAVYLMSLNPEPCRQDLSEFLAAPVMAI